MNKTKIDWCDMTWNPVTGCLHGCDYCYAKKIMKRFGMENAPLVNEIDGKVYDGIQLKEQYIDEIMYDLSSPVVYKGKKQPYPAGEKPTFHRYRLDEPQKIKKSQRIFVCSMADLFGDWVPDEWIQEVFEACQKAPWHKYLFLTKNPKRYRELKELPPENCWLGATVGQDRDKDHDTIDAMAYLSNNFLSAEPLHYDISNRIDYDNIDWVIVGQETGNRKGKIEPEGSWMRFLCGACKYYDIPVFIKEPLYKRFPIQELPRKLESEVEG